MKKLILLFAVTLAMGFTACSNDDIPVIDIQPEDVIGKWYAEYDQPGSFDANGVAVEYQKIAQYASFQENGNGFWSILFLDAAGKAIDIPGYSCGGTIKYTINDNTINVITVDGIMNAAIGDFILRDANGKYYVCKPDIFAETYMEVLDLTNIIPESGTEKIYNAAIQAMKDYSEKEK